MQAEQVEHVNREVEDCKVLLVFLLQFLKKIGIDVLEVNL